MPTVTIFSDTDALASAVADAVVARGSSAHIVSVPSGWPTTTNRAVLRLDTPAGRSAIAELVGVDLVVEVVVLNVEPPIGEVARWFEACEQRHHVTTLSIDPDDLAQPRDVAERLVGVA